MSLGKQRRGKKIIQSKKSICSQTANPIQSQERYLMGRSIISASKGAWELPRVGCESVVHGLLKVGSNREDMARGEQAFSTHSSMQQCSRVKARIKPRTIASTIGFTTHLVDRRLPSCWMDAFTHPIRQIGTTIDACPRCIWRQRLLHTLLFHHNVRTPDCF